MNRRFPNHEFLDLSDGYVEDYDETETSSKKDWFKPANVSLARLEKVKPMATIYNIAPCDPRDLHASRGKAALVAPADSPSGLQTEPPLSTVSYQKAAWGSQTSIPELLKQAAQAGTKPSRPSSAKTGTIAKPPMGKKSRPQSAKDPLCPSGKKKTPPPSTLGVKGHKFDPFDRSGMYGVPPGGTCVGWAGPPAGLHVPSEMTINTVQASNADLQKPHTAPPPPPNTSPEPQDADFIDVDSEQFSPSPLPGLCLSLSLPSADVDAADEPDTGRLLDEADKFVKKQKKTESQKIKFFKAETQSISEALKTSLSVPHQNHDPALENSEINDHINIIDHSISSHITSVKPVKQTTSDDNKTKIPDLDFLEENDLGFEEDTLKGPTVTELSLNLDKDPKDFNDESKATVSEKPLPPNNGFDLQYLGPAKQEQRRRSHPIFIMPEKKPSLQKEAGTNTKRQQDKRHVPANVDSKEDMKPRVKDRTSTEALSANTTQHQKNITFAGNSRSGVHIREDQNVTVDITPRNLGRKVATGKSGRKHRAGNEWDARSELSMTGTHQTMDDFASLEITATPAKHQSIGQSGRCPTATATVSVVYDDDDNDSQMSTKKKKKTRRGPVKEKDLVTMVSNISLSDDDDDDNDDPSREMDIDVTNNPDLKEAERCPSALSKGERNYYDIGRKQTKGNSHEPSANQEEKENFITMTTKTILFDRENPLESVVKTILDAPLTKQRVHRPSGTAVRPKSANRPRSAKLTQSDLHSFTPADIAPQQYPENGSCGDGGFTVSNSNTHQEPFEEERPASRMGFVPMKAEAKEDTEGTRLFSDPKEQHQGISGRPPSGRRRPLSAASRALNKSSALPSKPSRQMSKESVTTKQRPQSASFTVARSPSVAEMQRANAAVQALRSERERIPKSGISSRFADSRRQYASYTSSGRNRPRSASLTRKPVQIVSKIVDIEEEDTPALDECRDIQKRLACYGIDIKPQTLERALFPPSGRTLYYQLNAQLPKSYSNGLLSHPRYWLPEEHKRLKVAEKKLAMAELFLWRQKKEEERKARMAAGKEKELKKGKKKGKKKLRRSQSVC